MKISTFRALFDLFNQSFALDDLWGPRRVVKKRIFTYKTINFDLLLMIIIVDILLMKSLYILTVDTELSIALHWLLQTIIGRCATW